MKRVLIALLVTSACSVDLQIPEDANIVCREDDDCPPQSVCDVRNQCRSIEQAAKGVPGFDISPSSITVGESGTTGVINVRLNAQPAFDVTIVLAADDGSEASISKNILTFTPDNYGIAQAVTVRGERDCLADGAVLSHVFISPAQSNDPDYGGLDAPDVEVTTEDDVPSAGILVTPTTGLETSESGDVTQFSVVVACKPTADVHFTLASSDTSEGTIATSELTFTPDNWAVPRVINVAGKGDCDSDGDVGYAINLGTVASDDPLYTGIQPPSVALLNRDVAFGRVNITPNTGLRTTEQGGQATFSVTLTCQPSANVTVPLATSNGGEGTSGVTALTFTTANWNEPQAFIVTGVNDGYDDGNIAYMITTGAMTSADAGFNNLNPLDVAVTNEDDDTASVTVTPVTALQTTEAGGTAQLRIRLGAVPLAPVSISVLSSNTAEGSVGSGTVIFNDGADQFVTVTGIDDHIDDDNKQFTVVLGSIASMDPAFSGMAVDDVTLTNVDDDTAGFYEFTPRLYTSEDGGSDTAMYAVTTQPQADVSCVITHDFIENEIRVGATGSVTLTFPAGTYGVPQNVEVYGVPDSDAVPLETPSVRATCSSADPKYNFQSFITVYNMDPAYARRVYTTPAPGYTGSQVGTLANADSICTANAPAAGTWKAAIANNQRRACLTAACPSTEPNQWVFQPFVVYYWPNRDGIMGLTNASGVFTQNDWREGAPVGAGTVYNGGYWTGMNADFTTGANCSNWTNNTTGTGGIGLERANNPRDGFGWPTIPAFCSEPHRLLCVEQ